MKNRFWFLLAFLVGMEAHACIWDAESLSQEKSRSHDLAQTILGGKPAPEDPMPLRKRAQELEANRHETDPDWWNNLAGTYLRLNQPEAAMKLLAPVAARFPDNYGIHANLGTAYHLLHRYAEAEKEIARDLEINPDAHFGLEKYHLALLQYLVRDAGYQKRHLYVDEFTLAFLESTTGPFFFLPGYEEMARSIAAEGTNTLTEADAAGAYAIMATNEYGACKLLRQLAAYDPPPEYQRKWNLAGDTNREAGVIYMAQMNPEEPACFTMLGIAAWQKHDYHLAIAAFQQAIALGSPQAELLNAKIAGLQISASRNSLGRPRTPWLSLFLISLIPIVIGYYIYSKIRDRRRQAVPK
jgi:tetratricopeptide (TPR) repeat protein